MTITFNFHKRQCRAEVQTEDGPQVLVVTYRNATAAERQEMRCAVAATHAASAAAQKGDKAALDALIMQSDAPKIAERQRVACVVSIDDEVGNPVLFDGLPWAAMNDTQRADVATALDALFNLVFQQANPQVDARLLGK